MDQDSEHLRLLSIFQYIFAGLSLLGGCLSLIYVLFVGVFLASAVSAGPQAAPGAGPPPEVAVIGGILFFAVAVFSAFGLGIAACQFLCGKWLVERRHHGFCMAVAAFECLSVPLGTILGVFTLVVLLRPSVKASFDAVAYAMQYENPSGGV